MIKIFLVILGALNPVSFAFSNSTVVITCEGDAGKFVVSDREYPAGMYHLEVSDLGGHVKYTGGAQSYHSSARDTDFWRWVSLEQNFHLDVVTMYHYEIEVTDPPNLQCIWGEYTFDLLDREK